MWSCTKGQESINALNVVYDIYIFVQDVCGVHGAHVCICLGVCDACTRHLHVHEGDTSSCTRGLVNLLIENPLWGHGPYHADNRCLSCRQSGLLHVCSVSPIFYRRRHSHIFGPIEHLCIRTCSLELIMLTLQFCILFSLRSRVSGIVKIASTKTNRKHHCSTGTKVLRTHHF